MKKGVSPMLDVFSGLAMRIFLFFMAATMIFVGVALLYYSAEFLDLPVVGLIAVISGTFGLAAAMLIWQINFRLGDALIFLAVAIVSCFAGASVASRLSNPACQGAPDWWIYSGQALLVFFFGAFMSCFLCFLACAFYRDEPSHDGISSSS